MLNNIDLSSAIQNAIAQATRLVDQRHKVCQLQLGLHTGLLGGLSWVAAEKATKVSIPIFVSIIGIVLCVHWVLHTTQYSKLIEWWYLHIRVLEEGLASDMRSFTLEYFEIYEPCVSIHTKFLQSLAYIASACYLGVIGYTIIV